MADKLEFILGAKDEFSKTLGKFRSGINTAAKAAGIAAGAIAGTSAALFVMTKRTAETFDQLGKFSQRIGVSVEALSAYQHVAELSGISTQALNIGLQRMTRRISEASTGTGVAVKALAQLNINIKDIQDLAPDEQFDMIAESMQGLETQADRVRVAFSLFDTEGVGLLQTMEGGRAGLEAMKEEAAALGLVISERAAANAALFNDSLTRVQGSLKGLQNLIAEQVMPTITGLANRFTEFVVKNRKEIIDFGVNVLTVMRDIAEKGAFAVAVLIDAWRGLKMIWTILKIALNEYISFSFDLINKFTEKVISTMETLNFRGMFDGAIEGAKAFQRENEFAVESFGEVADQLKAELGEIAGGPLAITQVNNLREQLSLALEEIRAAGEVETALIEEKNAKEIEIEQSKLERLKSIWRQRKDEFSKLTEGLTDIAQSFGRDAFVLAKASAIAETIMSTWEGAQKTYTALAGINPIAAAAAAAVAVTAGFARVAQINAQTLPIAHTGLTQVPEERPFLLDRGERVVSTPQNQDLTDFLERSRQGGVNGVGGSNIEAVHVSILPNATSLDSLLNMGNDEWDELVQSKMLPALNRAQVQGAF
jgi:regulator of replication initiation timing